MCRSTEVQSCNELTGATSTGTPQSTAVSRQVCFGANPCTHSCHTSVCGGQPAMLWPNAKEELLQDARPYTPASKPASTASQTATSC